MVWFTELKSYLESFISNYLNVYVSIQSDPFKNHYSFNIFNWWRPSQSAQPWLQLNVINVEENGCMKYCLQIFCSKGIETRAEIECLIRLFASFGALRWRHNGPDSVSNHQPHDCLLNRLFRRRSKKTSKLRVTGLCVGNSPGTGEFPAQMASNAENVSIWWRHHVENVWLATCA